MAATVQLCRWALNEGDPDERVAEFRDGLDDADAYIRFVDYAWSQLRTMNAFMLELEIAKVSRLLDELRD